MTFPMPPTHTYTDAKEPDVKISFDNRHFPVLVAKPHRGWADDAVKYYFERWRAPISEYAVQKKTHFVIIFDMRTSKVPPATVRKTAGEFTATDSTTGGLLHTFIVVDNPMLRGVITAIMWLAGDVPMSFVATMPEAIRRAFEELEGKGVKPPTLNPDTYRFPINTSS